MQQYLQNKKGLVENVFNNVYDKYDLMNDFMSLGIHRVWKKNNSGDLEIHESIEPEKNLLIAGLQNNLAFHDVNPVKSIDGSRNAFYLAISCSSSVWKDVKSNEFNLKYNKNRVKLNIYQKINKFFF